jgi:hypothetical protein
MTILTRSRTLLVVESVTAETVTLTNDPESDRRRALIISRADWDDLGVPDALTITIQPGDHLQDD